MSTQESWADKIAKLLRKAEGASTAEEAEAFYSKAQELMAKYAIDEAMLAAAKGTMREKDAIVWKKFVDVGIWLYPMSRLTYYVLINNGLKAIKLSNPGWQTVGGKVYKKAEVLDAVGFESDLRNADVLRTSLQIQAGTAENRWWNEHSHLYSSLTPSRQHIVRRDYLYAFADGVHKKLSEATARGKAAAEEQHGRDSVALVLRDKSLVVQDALKNKYPLTRKRADRKNHGNAFARQHGYAAGKSADVGQPGLKNKREIER